MEELTKNIIKMIDDFEECREPNTYNYQTLTEAIIETVLDHQHAGMEEWFVWVGDDISMDERSEIDTRRTSGAWHKKEGIPNWLSPGQIVSIYLPRQVSEREKLVRELRDFESWVNARELMLRAADMLEGKE